MQFRSGIKLSLAFVLVFGSLLTGCNFSYKNSVEESDQHASKESSDAPKEGLAARLEAAKAIASNRERDNALAKVATDAADALDAKVSKEAVQHIGLVNLHDSTAAEAAMVLAKAGKTADATAIAKMISSDNLRDETLSKIAKGSE